MDRTNRTQTSTAVESSFFSMDYQPISHDEAMTNRLTRDNLQRLALFSESIQKPSPYGKFFNEKHYLATLEFVLASTHETVNRILFCLNQILPEIPHRVNLLDVGPGDGSLTKALAPHFQHTTLVDVNHLALDTLQKKLPASIRFEPIAGNILNVDLKAGCYDLAVLSHMLYYIEPNQWLETIKSVYRSLKINGTLVVILGGDELGKARLIKHFGGQVLEINQLAVQCFNTFGKDNVSLYASEEAFIACTREAMLHISGFMLADADIFAAEEDLNPYITRHLQCSDDYFEMTTRQKYIIIKKCA